MHDVPQATPDCPRTRSMRSADEYPDTLDGVDKMRQDIDNLDNCRLVDGRRDMLVTSRPSDALYLHAQWISGECEETGVKFDLTSGQGLGSSALIMHVETPHGKAREIIDISKLAQKWATAMANELKDNTDSEE